MPHNIRKKFSRIARESAAAPVRLGNLLPALFRHVLLGLLGSYLLSRGLVEEDAWKAVEGALITFLGFALSWWSEHKRAHPDTLPVRLLGLVRHAISSLSGIALALGWFGPDVVNAVASALGAIAASFLSAKAPEKDPLTAVVPEVVFDDLRILLAALAAASLLLPSCSSLDSGGGEGSLDVRLHAGLVPAVGLTVGGVFVGVGYVRPADSVADPLPPIEERGK